MKMWRWSRKPKAQATVASILLREARLPETDSLFIAHALWWPEVEQPQDISCERNIVQFHTEGANGNLVLTDFPEPDLFGGARSGVLDSSPDILQIAHANKALVMAALTSVRLNAVERAIRLTRWVASVAEACDALAVNWGSAGVLTPRENFCKLARAMDKDFLPLPLWISFAFDRQNKDSIFFTTRGMSEFGQWEIESTCMPVDESDLLNYAGSFALYLLTENPTVRDGDTIGFSEKDRIRVRRTEASDGSRFVYRLELVK